MPGKAFGIDIQDDQMAAVGKSLQLSHVSLLVLAILSFIFGLISWVMFNGTIAQMNKELDGDAASQGPEGLGGPIIGLVCTFICTFWVWNSMKSNDKSSLGWICIGEGICTACSIIGAVITVISILLFAFLAIVMSGLKETCERNRQAGYGGGLSNAEVDNCQESADAITSALSMIQIFYVITLLLQICQAICCCMGCMKANQAKTLMEGGKVFTGAPSQAAVVGAVVMGAAPVVVAVAQPVVVAVAQPVEAASQPAGEAAKENP